MPTTIMCEIPAELWDDPRAAAFELFADWLSNCDALRLPAGEVVLELVDGEFVDPVLSNGDEAVGVFLVYDPFLRTCPDEYRVVVAIGLSTDDTADWQARLESAAHELVHVVQFATTCGVTPRQAELNGSLQSWIGADSEPIEDEAEERGRKLTSRFLLESRIAGRELYSPPR